MVKKGLIADIRLLYSPLWPKTRTLAAAKKNQRCSIKRHAGQVSRPGGFIYSV